MGLKMRSLVLVLALTGLVGPAAAQQLPSIRIWDVKLGTPVAALPRDFVDPACGTAGGPPSTELASFADFAKCAPEASGLREVWFRYDDTAEAIARALRNPVQIARAQATAIGGSPIIVSLLIDAGGAVRGYRLYSDPRADPRTRYDAHTLAATFMGLLGTGWTCTSQPAADGENPIEGSFVKQACTIETATATGSATNRFYLKPGEAVVDPATGKPMVNAFESSASLEVVQKAPFPPALELPPTPPAPVAIPAGATDAVAAFLNGKANDCPGCDLDNADLSRRDLTGADLTGAKLSKVNFHRAILRQAKFAGADLESADLNMTDVSAADFSGADLKSALFYKAKGAQPVLDGADLSGAKLGSAEFRKASLVKATMLEIDLGQAHLNNAKLTGAVLTGSYLYQASLLRADLSGVKAERSNFVEAVLRYATLTGGTFTDSDFQRANLQQADLSNADMTHVRLQFGNLRDAVQDGTILTNAMLPDGSMHP